MVIFFSQYYQQRVSLARSLVYAIDATLSLPLLLGLFEIYETTFYMS